MDAAVWELRVRGIHTVLRATRLRLRRALARGLGIDANFVADVHGSQRTRLAPQTSLTAFSNHR